MTAPTCRWYPTTITVGQQAKFIFNTGGLDATVTGYDRSTSTYTYTSEQGPDIIIIHRFNEAGSFDWTVSSSEGTCTATLVVTE